MKAVNVIRRGNYTHADVMALMGEFDAITKELIATQKRLTASDILLRGEFEQRQELLSKVNAFIESLTP
jgi:hypothetical protein